MEDTMKVLELLEELEDIVDNATNVPLTSKIMLEAEDVFNIVREVRLALPDDVQQAKLIRDERDRILADAKAEYERIIREAKKQADYLVETDDITLRATKLAQEIREDAELHAKMLKMRSYDYVDKMLYDMQAKMDELNECVDDKKNAEKRLKESQEKQAWLEDVQNQLNAILDI